MRRNLKVQLQPHELRIGSWVNTPDMGPSMVRLITMHFGEYVIYHNNMDVKSFHNSCMLSECAPIKLTERWLRRGGFEIDGDYDYRNYRLKKNNFYISIWMKDKPCAGFEEKGVAYWGDSHLAIRYVHQLQTLFYVLTGKDIVFSV